MEIDIQMNHGSNETGGRIRCSASFTEVSASLAWLAQWGVYLENHAPSFRAPDKLEPATAPAKLESPESPARIEPPVYETPAKPEPAQPPKAETLGAGRRRGKAKPETATPSTPPTPSEPKTATVTGAELIPIAPLERAKIANLYAREMGIETVMNCMKHFKKQDGSAVNRVAEFTDAQWPEFIRQLDILKGGA